MKHKESAEKTERDCRGISPIRQEKKKKARAAISARKTNSGLQKKEVAGPLHRKTVGEAHQNPLL